jgi:hypothetical protein
VAPGAADADVVGETASIGVVGATPRDEAQLQHLRDELAKAREALAAREIELVETRQHAERAHAEEQTVETALSSARAAWNAKIDERLAVAAAHAQAQIAEVRERSQRETHEALLKAENGWKSAEAARLAGAQAQWREESAKVLAEARAHAGAMHDQSRNAELEALREKLIALQTTLAERENALTLAGSAVEQAREFSQREIQDAVAKAETAWKDAEAMRLAAAAAQWQEQSAKAVAEARAQAGRHDDRGNEAELQASREKAAGLQKLLGERDAALACAVAAAEQARLGSQREMQDALLKAEGEWRAQEAVRDSAVEAQLRKDSARALAEATARCEVAEAALAQARLKPKDDNRLQSELAVVRATLAKREAELVQARSAIGQAREQPEPESVAQPFRVRDFVKPPEKDRKPDNGRFIRDVSVAACFGVVGVVFYPDISALIFGDAPAPAPAKPVAAVSVPVAPPVAERRMAVARVAKLRAGPSTATDVVSTLQRGADVAVIEARGKWTLVRVEGEKGKTAPLQGWVSSALLKDAEPIEKKPPAAKGK